MYCVLSCDNKECINISKLKTYGQEQIFKITCFDKLYSDVFENTYNQCFNCGSIIIEEYSTYFRPILLNTDNSYIIPYTEEGIFTYYSQCFILGDYYHLYNPKTIIKFNTKRQISKIKLDLLLKHGKIQELITLHKHGFNIELSKLSRMFLWDHKNILLNLSLLKNYGFELCYTDVILDYASAKGYIHVLEWLFNSKMSLKYTERALESASSNGRVHVLEWWKNSGLSLKYTERALESASSNGHVHVLEWWKNSGLSLKYTERVLVYASSNGHVNVLEWWKHSGLKLNSDIPYVLRQSDPFNAI
jgi:hypothetical protein